jgi:hypothetical protein
VCILYSVLCAFAYFFFFFVSFCLYAQCISASDIFYVDDIYQIICIQYIYIYILKFEIKKKKKKVHPTNSATSCS